jgi:hypothetical protein
VAPEPEEPQWRMDPAGAESAREVVHETSVTRPVGCRLALACEDDDMATNSRWSLWSTDSILSIGSTGSALSVASIGSFASIGSIGSFASAGSIGSSMSRGSVLSNQSQWSLMSHRSDGAVMGTRRHGPLTPWGPTLMAATLAGCVYIGYRRGRSLDGG